MLISAHFDSIAAASASLFPGEAWSDGTLWSDGTGWIDGMSQAGVICALVCGRPARPDDSDTPLFGERRGQPVRRRGPAASSPPRRGVPAETAARC